MWSATLDELPGGTVILEPAGVGASLVIANHLQRFAFGGWEEPRPRPVGVSVRVLTPPSSVAALRNGFEPTLHVSAARPG